MGELRENSAGSKSVRRQYGASELPVKAMGGLLIGFSRGFFIHSNKQAL